MPDKPSPARSTVSWCRANGRTVLLGMVVLVSTCTMLVFEPDGLKLSQTFLPRTINPSAYTPSGINQEWLKKRQTLLAEPGRPKKVLLITYMRGGSSFAGELFKKNPGAMYWYEVAASFYSGYFAVGNYAYPLKITFHKDESKREVLQEEKTVISEFFQNLYSCNMSALPIATLVHSFMDSGGADTSKFYKCLRKLRNIGNHKCVNGSPVVPSCSDDIQNGCFHNLSLAIRCLREGESGDPSCENQDIEPFLQHQRCYTDLLPRIKPCLRSLKASCEKARIHSAKVHRITMESLETLIQDMPDLHIIYYSRDPRGILSSRRKVKMLLKPANEQNPEKEAKMLCERMLSDLQAVRQYESRYPGSIMRLSYEDLAANPMGNLKKMYDYIGKEHVPKEVSMWLETATRDLKSSGFAFGTRRTNSTATSLEWQTMLGAELIMDIDDVCSEVYRERDAGDAGEDTEQT